MNTTTKKVQFLNGNEAPALGFGTWQLTGKTAVNAVFKALETGFRHIDTADIYANHREVAKAIRESGIKREELFLTTKVWRAFLTEDQIKDSVKKFQEELKTDYFDLLLIHWPDREVPIQETLGTMAELNKAGVIKNYGVSNFTINHLKETLKAGFHPVTNQVEFHPSFNQKELKDFCDQNDIIITAYSPLGQGIDFTLDTILHIAAKYSKSKAQVILNWIIQKKMIAIPRSSSPEHIEDNFETLEWEMETEDIKKIDNIHVKQRILNPSFAEFDYQI